MIDVRIGNSFELIKELPDKSIDMVMTSPPYYSLRDYKTPPIIFDGVDDCEHDFSIHIEPKGNKSGVPGPNATVGARFAQDEARRGSGTDFCFKCGAWRGQLGLEPTPELFIKHLLDFFDDVKLKLKDSGNIFVNLGDSYAGSGVNDGTKNAGMSNAAKRNDVKGTSRPSTRVQGLKAKCLCMIPQRFAWGMIERGWILRNQIVWYKKNHMPESVTDRWTKSYELVYFFTKQQKNYFNLDAIREPLKTTSIERYKYDHNGNKDGIDRAWSGSPIMKGTKYQGKFNTTLDIESFGSPRARTQRKQNDNEDIVSIMGFQPRTSVVLGKQRKGKGDTGCRTQDCLHDDRGNISHPNGKNPGDVWTINTQPYSEAHFATFPLELVRSPILAGCPPNGVVLDTFAGCYDGETEILTKNGFKPFPYLTIHDIVASLDVGHLVWVKPIEVQRFQYEGNMLHFTGSHIDLLVTPNHRMYVRKRHHKKDEFVFVEASKTSRQDEMKRDCLWAGNNTQYFTLPIYKSWPHNQFTEKNTNELKIEMNAWLKFFGLWVAEGCTPTNSGIVQITQTTKTDRVKEILDALPFTYLQYGKDFRIYSHRLHAYLSQFGKCKEKYIPTEFKNLASFYLKSLIYGLILGDGSIRDNGHLTYYTVSKQLSDDIQEVFLKLGYAVQVNERSPRTSIIRGRLINSKRMQYTIYASVSHHTPKIKNVDSIDYSGGVYCCTVPSNIILVRRKGKLVWCGNSGTVGEFCRHNNRNAILFELNPEYKPLIEKRTMLRIPELQTWGDDDNAKQ